jgi:hypothetical protein
MGVKKRRKKRRKPGRPALTAEQHRARGTFQPCRHADSGLSGTGVIEDDPTTWFVNFSPYERRLWAEYLVRYIPGDRLASYRFISWQAACESAAYWVRKRGDLGFPELPTVRAASTARLADLFKATKWRRRR